MTETKRFSQNIFLAFIILIVSLFIGFGSLAVHAFTTDPTPTQYYVTDDYAHLMSYRTKSKVVRQEKYYKYHTATHPQVVMMTVPNTDGESAQSYSNDIWHNNRWHIGSKKFNDGVLILFAKDHGENHVQISTGYGIESILPDLRCKHILVKNESLLKSHNNTKVNKGLRKVFKDVTRVINQHYVHLTKSQAMGLIKARKQKKIKKVLASAVVIAAALIILTVPWNGKWFCFAIYLYNGWISFDNSLDNAADDDDDNHHSGFFGGFGGSSGGGFFDAGGGGASGGGGAGI